ERLDRPRRIRGVGLPLECQEIGVERLEMLLELREERDHQSGGQPVSLHRVPRRRRSHAALSAESLEPSSSMLRAACSTCRVATRFCLATSSRLRMAWLIWAMPIACWPAEATIWAAATSASLSVSASVVIDWPA